MKDKRIIAALMCAAIPVGTAMLPVTASISAAASSGTMTFEELYALEENELEQYCSEHDLTYISKEAAKSTLEIRREKWVAVMPKDYMLKGVTDLLESEKASDLNRKNYYDYDFEKIASDLNMPEKYYKIDTENNDFAFYKKSETDADGNTKDTYVKVASIDVELDPSVTDEDSMVRLYQLISVWTEQNPLVYKGITFRYGPAPDSKIETIEIETLGDVNADGKIDAVDASSILAYYAQISTNQIGKYTEDQKLSADVNNDKMINSIDASNILAYYAYTSTAPKGESKSLEEYLKK
ncbi:dockerin type I domain-containing protein [Ruminococcus flavefaciens]|uniref:Dockerin domain-containing protein n=1 Tax=Ruminococcus flavefaciens TaxID=1265 RepID=A0A1M7GPC5_RUMFL|nr:dockerin type I domain-containing protein [Ruminococcus flavefaciens]SHM18018.1 hypothetical protein SAMN04487860_101414 [Ruminococcus flavefaciens]